MGPLTPILRPPLQPILRSVFDVGVGGGGFSPASLFANGEQGAWYDPSDLSTLFQDAAGTTPVTASGQPVGLMRDKSGRGNHASQATATARPIFTVAGGMRFLDFDGVDDWLLSTFPRPQPWERISAFGQKSWSVSKYVFGGSSANAGIVYQNGASPGLGIGSGATISFTPPSLSPIVLSEKHQGSSSRVAINKVVSDPVNLGALAADGIRIGASSVGTNCGSILFYGLVARDGVLTQDQRDSIAKFFASKAGVTL